MSQHTRIFRDILKRNPEFLTEIRRGIEKESLRVDSASGTLSQMRHPLNLGSALTHSSITTDYSEALLEFITPVSQSVEDCELALAHLHQFTSQNLSGELLWNASMPCGLGSDQEIPIAEFGSSNVGMMKRIYRNGLSARYGPRMQTIAGLHYNFSLPETFWKAVWQTSNQRLSLRDLQTDGYLALIRNFFTRSWLLIYLLGASPAVCSTFLDGNPGHPLTPMGDTVKHSYYLPFATSLRMGDLGYTSRAQATLAVCYNSLEEYISTLKTAILTPHESYRNLKSPVGEISQLNDSMLQIENEYYSPIRPKRVTRSGQAPLVALKEDGIEYVEIRCIDVNPFLSLGIDANTMHLLDLFLISCLIEDSPLCDENAQKRQKLNFKRVINQGRQPGLTLVSDEGVETSVKDLALPILNRMEEISQWLDEAVGEARFKETLQDARDKVNDASKTPSAKVLAGMESSRQGFQQFGIEYSRKWHQVHSSAALPQSVIDRFTREAKYSVARQNVLESSDLMNFSDYLRRFYRQYDRLP